MRYKRNIFLKYIFFISLCIGMFLYTSVSANTASMDPNFYTNTPIGFNNALASMYIQSDGKILIGGFFTAYKGIPINRIIRLKTDGTRDTSFTIGDGFDSDITSIVTQDDGKILVGGAFWTYDGIATNKIIRLNTNGSRDSSFDIGAGFNTSPKSIILQSDGKILIGGDFTSYKGVAASKIIRLNTDGSRDTSFIIGAGFNASANSIILQSDGKILIGGDFTSYKGVAASKIIRLNTDGSRDPYFDIGEGFNGNCNYITTQNDGKILVGGAFKTYKSAPANKIVRLNTDGSRDSSFDMGSGFDDSPNSIILQGDGKILIGGFFTTYKGILTNRIVRLNTDGSIDSSFDVGDGFNSYIQRILLENNGELLVLGSFSTYNGMPAKSITRLHTNGTNKSFFGTGKGFNNDINGLNIQNDGKFLVGGKFTLYDGIATNKIIRLNTNGSRDSSFDIGSGFNQRVNVISTQNDGKILVGGAFGEYQGIESNKIIRLNSDGSRDSSFTMGSGFDSTTHTIAIQNDGKILVGGAFNKYKGIAAKYIIRLNSDGSRDSSFDVGAGCNNQVSTIHIQNDGKILVGGFFTSYKGVAASKIIRLNSDGSRDSSFDIGAGFNGNSNYITMQNDGKILVGGAFSTYKSIESNRIIRLNTDGSRDSSFDIGAGFNGNSNYITTQNDGKILVGGDFTLYNGVKTNRIIRLNSDGTRDSSFDAGDGFNSSVRNIVIQKNGGFLIAGVFLTYHGYSAAYITSVYGNSELVVLPNSTNTQSINTEFTSKGYNIIDNKFVGSTSISLNQTNGNIPISLQIKNQNIILSLPANTQCKKADNITNYNDILAVPRSRSLYSIDNASVISAFNVGSTSESIKLVGGVATISAPVVGANIGDIVNIYYSEDNGGNWYPHASSKVINYNGQTYVTFTTNHFTDFAITLPTQMTGTFTINNNATSTNTKNVTLNISTTPPATNMRFSNDGIAWSARENYTTTKSRTLLVGYEEKTVYAQLDTNNDNIADIEVSDTITYTDPDGGGTVIGNISLKITKAGGSCSYGTSLYIGSHAAQFTAYTMTGTNFSNDGGLTNTTFECRDIEGNTNWAMTMQATSNLSNGVQFIPKTNVFMVASSNYLSAGNCTTGTNQTDRGEIGTNPGTIINKIGNYGDICTLTTNMVNLAVHIPENQAVGVYTGELLLIMPF